MAFKRVVVKLHNLLNDNTGSDPGNELEVFGRFDVTRLVFNPDIGEVVPLESFNLFDRSGDNAQDIVEGTAFIIESSATLNIQNGEFLQITGHIGEQDTFGPNDDLGSVDLRFPFNQIATGLVTQMPVFEDSGQRVIAKMSVTVAQQG
jgi:hypothetical protein